MSRRDQPSTSPSAEELDGLAQRAVGRRSGVDPISMVIAMVPLVAVYELGILMASALPARAPIRIGDPA